MSRHRQILLWAALGIAGLVGLAILHFWVPSGGASSSICVFRRLSGIPCPGCGMTRAFAHLAKGEWGEAARDHPLSFLIAAEMGLFWLAWGFFLLRGRAFLPPRQDVFNALVLGHLLLLSLLWLGRLILGTLPG